MINRHHICFSQTKFCKKCRISQPSDGGFWVIFNQGKNRYWLCAKHKHEELDESLYTGLRNTSYKSERC